MSEHPNVLAIRRGYDAFNKGDTEALTPLFDEAVIWPGPLLVVVPEEVLQPQGGFRCVRYHVGTPVLVILDSPHLDLRRVDVDPVVRK